MKPCGFEGCKKPSFSRGLCGGHYHQKRRGEQLKPLQKQIHGLSETERFLALVDVKTTKECWNWTASIRPDGYGQWRNAKGATELAHRAAWRLLKSHIPGRSFVLHRCDNPKCANPSHLFLGSQTDNMRDMWNKGRARPGLLVGEAHGMSKATAEMVKEIRSSDESGVVLAERFNLKPTTVCDIRKFRTWKHIT